MRISGITGPTVTMLPSELRLKEALHRILRQDARISDASAIAIRVLNEVSPWRQKIVVSGLVASPGEKRLVERLLADATDNKMPIVNRLLVETKSRWA